MASDRQSSLDLSCFIMNTQTACRIASMDRLSDGVVVAFEDGRCAFFSTSLLYEILPQAEDLTNLLNPDEEA